LRQPFFITSTIAVGLAGLLLLAGFMGFQPLKWAVLFAIGGIVTIDFAAAEITKCWFFRHYRTKD
jgi:hypothetical protein